ncbi:MAG: hypothetical protein H6841_03970 [Planctomycetes bacterium]|nr:hypothetical protein [Planctomycetota bacterium]MCB9934533.1 hypothetical protein [Planctomycetota bacterium]
MTTTTKAAGVSIEPGVDDQQAMRILNEAAAFLGEFFALARQAVANTDPVLLANVLKEEPGDVTPEPDARKRPRGSTHPLLLLFKLGVNAAKALPRILAWTNPELDPRGGTDRSLNAAMKSTQSMMEGLEKLMSGLSEPTG